MRFYDFQRPQVKKLTKTRARGQKALCVPLGSGGENSRAALSLCSAATIARASYEKFATNFENKN
jgi:hypothetical protein